VCFRIYNRKVKARASTKENISIINMGCKICVQDFLSFNYREVTVLCPYDVCGNDSRWHIHQIEINIAAQINTIKIVANPEHDMFSFSVRDVHVPKKVTECSSIS
jgi:hypothetical protein